MASLRLVKRFARILGLLGGIGAVLWAMRDRFISLTVPREPEPPAFRDPPEPSSASPSTDVPASAGEPAPADADEAAEPDDLTAVNGVGPVYAERLASAGITTFAMLAAMTSDQLGEVLGSRISKVDTILEDAKRLASG